MAIAGGFTWEETTATVYVGQTITVPIASDSSKNEVPGFGPTEVADIVSASNTELQIIGQSEGTLTIPAGTIWIEESPAMDMETTNSFTLTVLPDEPKVAKQSQWEDLVGRIGDKTPTKALTTQDYNYVSGTYRGIALWQLPSGFYTVGDEDIKVFTKNYDGTGAYTLTRNSGSFVIVKGWTNDTTGRAGVLIFDGEALISQGGLDQSGRPDTSQSEFNFYFKQVGNGKINSSSGHPYVTYAGSWDGDEYWTGIYRKVYGNNITAPTMVSYWTEVDGSSGWEETRLATYEEMSSAVPVITMQTTDPGEGATLAANNFIAVYDA